MLYTTLIVFHVILAAALIAIVLVQRGPGATMGAAFGAGASGTVFGARGSASFLTRTTTWMGIAFFAISLSMAVILARSAGVSTPVDDLGVAAGLDSGASVEAIDTADEEFLTLPIDGEPASTGGEEMMDEADQAMDDIVEAVSSDAEASADEAAEPPPES